jgi:single-stranded-DNA-specific exonuclease
MEQLAPRFRWVLPSRPELSDDLIAAGEQRGLSHRLIRILAARGHTDPKALASFLDEPAAGLHDPALLPDAATFAARVGQAAANGERALVFGDFDADGLSGLAIMTLALRRLGIDTEPYVPDRNDEGHGLSMAAVEHAATTLRSLIITVDCGTSSSAEIAAAARRGMDVLVTDHHRVPADLPPAMAVVNPQRADSRYPDSRLAGSGVAFKLAQLLLADEPEAALALADLAAIGTVADVAPVTGENRCIVRLGLDILRSAPRPGLAAVMQRAGLERQRVDLESLSFGVAPRLNAAGRIGDGGVAARLLLSTDEGEATELASQLESANGTRREWLATALAEARAALESDGEAAAAPLTLIAGPWSVGIIGLVAGRLADERGRPAVVFSDLGEPWRGSARSAGGLDLAAAFHTCAELFERYGGHAAAAGCHMQPQHYGELRRRLTSLIGPWAAPEPELALDLALKALDIDYRLLRELALLEPAGTGNPVPLIGVAEIGVARIRAASGGHTQLTLRKGHEVVDGICFGRDDLSATVREGDSVDVVGRLMSRTFGGYESLQLEIRDVAPAGTLRRLLADRRTARMVEPAPTVPVLAS